MSSRLLSASPALSPWTLVRRADLDLSGTRSESDLKAVLTARLGRHRL